MICPQWGLCTPTCNSVIISGLPEPDALEISLYPNPSPGLFSLKENEFSEIHIINTLGKTVYKNDALQNVKSVNLDHLPSGVYQCVLTSEYKRLIQKIQIIK